MHLKILNFIYNRWQWSGINLMLSTKEQHYNLKIIVPQKRKKNKEKKTNNNNNNLL